jgi:hypothetical protein
MYSTQCHGENEHRLAPQKRPQVAPERVGPIGPGLSGITAGKSKPPRDELGVSRDDASLHDADPSDQMALPRWASMRTFTLTSSEVQL